MREKITLLSGADLKTRVERTVFVSRNQVQWELLLGLKLGFTLVGI